MPNIDITKPELIWPGKYDDNGNRVMSRGVALPFQVVETIREGRATREPGRMSDLFSYAKPQEQREWKNKLIWGDNLLVMASLLQEFAGKIDLIYIDPPFATGSDFSYKVMVGDDDAAFPGKEPSLVEEKAYRDTWGSGVDSYLTMIEPRLRSLYDLLSPTGSLFVHVDVHIGPYLKIITVGNDSKMNSLILNVNGEFELRQSPPYDFLQNDPTVVIRHETFAAGNGYVGLEASQDSAFIKDHYASSLAAWIVHLKTGKTQEYSDTFLGNNDADALMEELKAIREKWVAQY